MRGGVSIQGVQGLIETVPGVDLAILKTDNYMIDTKHMIVTKQPI